MQDSRYGQLLNTNAKILRQYFREAVKLLGIYVIYRAPYPGKHYTTYGEIDSNFEPPIKTGVLFHDHPDQKTLRKIGWVSELQEGSSLIEVDYDLPNLQQGSLFIIPSGIDNAKGRLFKVVSIQNSMVYPASITCEIVPEYEDSIDVKSDIDYSRSSYSLLSREDDNEISYEDVV